MKRLSKSLIERTLLIGVSLIVGAVVFSQKSTPQIVLPQESPRKNPNYVSYEEPVEKSKVKTAPISLAPTPTVQPTRLPTSSPTETPSHVKVDSLSPNTGKFEDEFTVRGVNFGGNPGFVVFYVEERSTTEGIGGPILSWSDTEIKARVPFMRGKRTYKVGVKTADGIRSNKLDYTVTAGQPIIDTLSPAGVAPGGQITIRGSELGNTPGQVNFHVPGSYESASGASVISSWSDTTIVCNIPEIIAADKEYGVQLITTDGRKTSFKFYNVGH